jgi:hypothetical protein
MALNPFETPADFENRKLEKQKKLIYIRCFDDIQLMQGRS